MAGLHTAATTIQARQRGIMGRATSAEMRAAKVVAALASLAATSAFQCAAAATQDAEHEVQQRAAKRAAALAALSAASASDGAAAAVGHADASVVEADSVRRAATVIQAAARVASAAAFDAGLAADQAQTNEQRLQSAASDLLDTLSPKPPEKKRKKKRRPTRLPGVVGMAAARLRSRPNESQKQKEREERQRRKDAAAKQAREQRKAAMAAVARQRSLAAEAAKAQMLRQLLEKRTQKTPRRGMSKHSTALLRQSKALARAQKDKMRRRAKKQQDLLQAVANHDKLHQLEDILARHKSKRDALLLKMADAMASGNRSKLRTLQCQLGKLNEAIASGEVAVEEERAKLARLYGCDPSKLPSPWLEREARCCAPVVPSVPHRLSHFGSPSWAH